MASRYWVGGTGNWNGTNTANWSATDGGASGASVPTSNDNVFFTSNSGTGTCTIITANPLCHSLDATGSSAITLTSSGARTMTIGGQTADTTAAVLTLGGSFVFSPASGFNMTFDNRSGGLTITSNGITFGGTIGNMNITSAVATVGFTVADDTTFTTGSIVQTRGTVTINSGVTFTVASYAATGTTAKGISYSGATFKLTGGAGFTSTGASGLTITDSSTSILELSGNNASTFNVAQALTFAGEVKFTSVGQPLYTGTACTFKKFTRVGNGTGSGLEMGTNATISNSGTVTFTGTSTGKPILIYSNVLGTARSIITGTTVTFSVSDTQFRDITVSGSTSLTSGTNMGNGGGNSGISGYRGAASYYWVGGTGSYSDDVNHWAPSSGGTPAANNFPLIQDTAVFDTNSFSANGQTVTFDNSCYGTLDMSLATNFTFNVNGGGATAFPDSARGLYNDVSLSSQGTYTFATLGSPFITLKRSTQTFTSNGASITLPASSDWQISNLGGTFQTTDDFNLPTVDTGSGISLINGTFNPLGNVTCPVLTDSGGLTKAFTGTANKTIFLTATGILLNLSGTGTTVTGNSMNITTTDSSTAGDKTLYFANGSTWGDITFAGGQNTITIAKVASAGTVTLGNVKCTTIASFPTILSWVYNSTFGDWIVTSLPSGLNSSNKLTYISTAAANQVKITGALGPLVVEYVNLKDMLAGSNSPYYAGDSSTNVSGNTGWTFTHRPYSPPQLSPQTERIYQAVNRLATR